jgi:hypothetical protein
MPPGQHHINQHNYMNREATSSFENFQGASAWPQRQKAHACGRRMEQGAQPVPLVTPLVGEMTVTVGAR